MWAWLHTSMHSMESPSRALAGGAYAFPEPPATAGQSLTVVLDCLHVRPCGGLRVPLPVHVAVLRHSLIGRRMLHPPRSRRQHWSEPWSAAAAAVTVVRLRRGRIPQRRCFCMCGVAGMCAFACSCACEDECVFACLIAHACTRGKIQGLMGLHRVCNRGQPFTHATNYPATLFAIHTLTQACIQCAQFRHKSQPSSRACRQACRLAGHWQAYYKQFYALRHQLLDVGVWLCVYVSVCVCGCAGGSSNLGRPTPKCPAPKLPAGPCTTAGRRLSQLSSWWEFITVALLHPADAAFVHLGSPFVSLMYMLVRVGVLCAVGCVFVCVFVCVCVFAFACDC